MLLHGFDAGFLVAFASNVSFGPILHGIREYHLTHNSNLRTFVHFPMAREVIRRSTLLPAARLQHGRMESRFQANPLLKGNRRLFFSSRSGASTIHNPNGERIITAPSTLQSGDQCVPSLQTINPFQRNYRGTLYQPSSFYRPRCR